MPEIPDRLRTALADRYRIEREVAIDVLRFDERSRPHSTASNGIAEYNGWRYFTLSDFQADIRVASVKGLSK